MGVGTVQVELNIEEHLTSLLKRLLRLAIRHVERETEISWASRSKAQRTAMMGRLTLFQENTYQRVWGQIMQNLNYLEGLEAREPGSSKFIEITEIREIKKIMRAIPGPPMDSYQLNKYHHKYIEEAMAMARKLEQMELRFG